jgi:membrane associated rhomboid family serine protease
VFPLRDENPTEIVPFVTLSLIAVTCAAWWFLQGAGLSVPTLEASVCAYGAIPAEVTGRPAGGGASPCSLGGLTWEAVPASMFMHGGWMHLIGNMWFLWVFGNNIEDSMGHLRFLAFYLVAGVLAALAQIAVDPDSAVPMVGASGAISAIMGAYLVLYPRARVDTLFILVFFIRLIPLPAWMMLGYWILLQVVSSTLAPAGEGGVAYMAHIGGFVAGVALIFLFRDPARVGRHRARKRRVWAGRWP